MFSAAAGELWHMSMGDLRHRVNMVEDEVREAACIDLDTGVVTCVRPMNASTAAGRAVVGG